MLNDRCLASIFNLADRCPLERWPQEQEGKGEGSPIAADEVNVVQVVLGVCVSMTGAL